jgi:GNAT superfamily N-acetyltransferase
VETGDVLSPGSADASVRPARGADAGAVGAVQARCWRQTYAALAPREVLARLDPAVLAERWRGAVTTPPPRHAVLVACTGATVIGFAALAPSAAPDASPGDGELVALEVDPAHRRAGHGSRLLAASVDTLRASGFTTLYAWCPAQDEARHAFFVSAGLRPDGARRELSGDGSTAVEQRLWAALDS